MEKPDKEKVWREVLKSIKVSVSPAIFSTWLSQTHLYSLRKLDTNRYMAEVGCSSVFVKATVEQRYFGLIQDVIMKILETPTDLTFVVKANPNKVKEKEGAAPLFEERDSNEELTKKLGQIGARLDFTFENFAVSPSNQMAHAAAEAVAEQPGAAYNPLFIWGGVGVGKTHLMHSVARKILERDLNKRIVICTGEDFTNDIVEGIRNKTTQAFRNKYRKVDGLFIDDIQFIAGKDAVQDEFFHTFNAVVGGGGQIILTSDQPAAEIPKLEDRLRSRFEAGLSVDIGPADFELRCAIVQIKAAERRLELPAESVHMIAGNVNAARKIEGVLMRIMSEVKLKKVEITEELIQRIISKGVGQEERKKRVSTDEVIEAVCKHYEISRRAITGKARARMIARPRQILMYLLRTELSIPLEEVGRTIGGRDHSTVIHAVDKISRLASEDVQIREDILQIKNTF